VGREVGGRVSVGAGFGAGCDLLGLAGFWLAGSVQMGASSGSAEAYGTCVVWLWVIQELGPSVVQPVKCVVQRVTCGTTDGV